jgi:hypothetical protein
VTHPKLRKHLIVFTFLLNLCLLCCICLVYCSFVIPQVCWMNDCFAQTTSSPWFPRELQELPWAATWWRQVSSDPLCSTYFTIHYPEYHDQPKDLLGFYLSCPWLSFWDLAIMVNIMLVLYFCRRFETGGSLSRRVSVPRAPAQMGRARGRARRGEGEVAGDGRERGGNPAAFVFVPRPGRVRLQ